MKINKLGNKKRLFIAAGLGLAAILVILIYLDHHYALWPFSRTFVQSRTNVINYSKPTTDELKNGNSIKKSNADSTTNSKPTGSDQALSPVNNQNGTSTVDLTITSANISNDTLVVRTVIGYVTNTGSCDLNLESGSTSVYSATSGVQGLSSSSTCKGFSADISKLPHGDYTLFIKFSDGTIQASTNRKVTL